MNSPQALVPARLRPLLAVVAVLEVALLVTTFVFYDILRLRLALPWNVFLATLPLLFSLLMLRTGPGRTPLAVRVLLGALWLFFYPNAPYMITDLLHLERYEYYRSGVGFLPDPAAWFGMLHLGAGVLVGVLCGALSLWLLHRRVRERWGSGVGWGFCAAVSALSAVGIYLGRFLRFNTWDLVTRPLYLLERALASLGPEFPALWLIFALMTLVPYLLFHACMREVP